MTKIILCYWREGLKKVSLTKLQVELLGKSLKESKSNVDALLEGKEVIIEITSSELVDQFIEEAEKIGVNVKIARI